MNQDRLKNEVYFNPLLQVEPCLVMAKQLLGSFDIYKYI